jgi:DUF4097 and DUF4098 domain-containing protein YvlB
MKQLLLVAVAGFALSASAATLEENFDRTFNVRPGTLFELNNTNGRITIHSWDQPRVQVHALKRVESRDSSTARQAMAELKIQPSATSDALRINTEYPRHNDGFFDWLAGTNVNMSVQYEVTVPRAMSLMIENTNGAIDISNVHGSLHVSNTNGHVECSQCGGNLEAETTNGAIRAELSEVTPGKASRLETTNGGIRVTLPRTAGLQIDAANTNGSIKTDVPVTTNSLGRHALRGTINGGGPELRLRTTNGSIDIQAR